MRRAALALAAAAALLLSGCTAEPAPDPAEDARPVTTEEAQLLAIARFGNFDAGSRTFSTEVDDEGRSLTLHGWVDFAAGLGWAGATSADAEEGLLWNDASVGLIAQDLDEEGLPALPIPSLGDAGWRTSGLDPSAYQLDALLAGLSALGTDRPDNPLLVQQSGALFLREDEVEGTPVTVFAAPPSEEAIPAEEVEADTSALRLWLDADGLMLRAELRLGGDWHTIDLPPGEAPALELPAA